MARFCELPDSARQPVTCNGKGPCRATMTMKSSLPNKISKTKLALSHIKTELAQACTHVTSPLLWIGEVADNKNNKTMAADLTLR